MGTNHYGILLTPVEADSNPSIDLIFNLLSWLVEQDDLNPITDSHHVRITTFLRPDSDIEQEVNFKDTGNELKSFLNQKKHWSMTAWASSRKTGLIAQALELRFVNKIDEEEMDEWFLGFDRIEIFHMNVKSYLDWGSTDPSKLDRNFAILLHTDIKADGYMEEAEEYFELAWPKFISSGAISQLEQVLGFKLEAQPFVA